MVSSGNPIKRASEQFKTFGIETEGIYKFNTGAVSGIKGVTDYNSYEILDGQKNSLKPA